MVPSRFTRWDCRKSSHACNGEVFDLSASGIGVYLDTRNVPGRGQVLAGVSVNLPWLSPLKTKLEVRFARQEGAHHRLHVGTRFVGLSPAQERKIMQFIAKQQLKHQRRAP